jgi:hypothetical protein
VDTDGFACPNPQCAYCGITNAHVHAPLWGWQAWSDRADPDVSLPGLPYHVHFQAQHASVSSENSLAPDRDGADLALAEGLDSSAAERVAGLPTSHHHQPFWLALANMHRPCTNVSFAISGSRICNWMNCAPGCEATNRSSGCGWPSIPEPSILPVLHLGPRTQHMAHTVIHTLRESLAPGCLPLFTSDGLNLYFYALTAHFGQWLQVGRPGHTVRQWQVAAGLIYGQVKKS